MERRRGYLGAIALLVAGQMLSGGALGVAPPSAEAQEAEADDAVVAVIDATDEVDCQIQIITYAPGSETDVIDDTGWDACGDDAGVVHSFPTTREEAESLGAEYVELSGDAAADEAAVEVLLDQVSPDSPAAAELATRQARPEGRAAVTRKADRRGNGKGRNGVAASSVDVEGEGPGVETVRCDNGVYPQNYTFNGRYRADLYDGGPRDVWIKWSFTVKRISCEQYKFLRVQNWIDRRPEQILAWSDYWYRDVKIGATLRSEPFCYRMDTNVDRKFRDTPPWGYIYPDGKFTTRSTNDRFCNVIAGETFEGYWFLEEVPRR